MAYVKPVYYLLKVETVVFKDDGNVMNKLHFWDNANNKYVEAWAAPDDLKAAGFDPAMELEFAESGLDIEVAAQLGRRPKIVKITELPA